MRGLVLELLMLDAVNQLAKWSYSNKLENRCFADESNANNRMQD